MALTIATPIDRAEARPGERLERLFDVADADNDGGVSAAEWTAIRDTMFDRLDANDDGVIDATDPAPERVRERFRQARAERLAQADSNGDGAIDKEEFLSRGPGGFGEVDANGDGAITIEELTAARDRLRASFRAE